MIRLCTDRSCTELNSYTTAGLAPTLISYNMQGVVQQLSSGTRCLSPHQKRTRLPVMVSAEASAPAAGAGNNVLGEAIRKTYGDRA